MSAEKFAVSDQNGNYVFYTDDHAEATQVRNSIDSTLAFVEVDPELTKAKVEQFWAGEMGDKKEDNDT
ncbi:MAG: hypothetical protein V3T17_02610 [Pseudomonadales bacterium]